MRHKWNRKLEKKAKWSQCLRCGLIKEVHFPIGQIYYYQTPFQEFLKAPPCKNLNDSKRERSEPNEA